MQQSIENLKATLKKIVPGLRRKIIIDYLDHWLLDEEQVQILGLNPWNIFFLSAAAHLFEVGTSGFKKDLEPGKIEISSAKLIKTHWKTLGIIDEDQALIIALICSNIMSDNSGSDPLIDSEKVEYGGDLINITLLSSAIRLAAELDLENANTAQAIATSMTARDQIPLELFCNSFSVSSAGPHAFLPGTIQIRICCSNFAVHRALKHHESWIQKLLHSINSQVSPRFLFSEIIIEIEPTGYIPLDMKFTVDSMAALQLFTGNRLYSDKRVFLRELIQNAVDACNLKKLFDPDYTPKISIDFDSQTRVIKFRDNGIGMDRQWIEKYFLKIGISFYQSGDIKNIHQKSVDFNFISKFGIGFLSSFLVSDRIVIKTCKKGSSGLLITITNLQDYFDVRFSQEGGFTGTEVTLYFKETGNNYARGMAYRAYLITNMRYLTIPVELLEHEGKTTILGQEKFASAGNDKTDCDFIASLNFTDSEGYLFLKAKQDLDSLYALDSSTGGVSIFQDGIFVTQTDSLLPESARQNVIGRINLKGKDRCELSMDRNRIFWTEQQLQHIKRTIRLGMVDLANQLLTDTLVKNPSLTIKDSLINHLAIFFDFNEIDDEMYRRLGQPVRKIIAKRFRDFVRVQFAHTGKQNNVPDADGYGEKWQQEILETFAKKSRPPLPI